MKCVHLGTYRSQLLGPCDLLFVAIKLTFTLLIQTNSAT